jgi:hypothetical protein
MMFQSVGNSPRPNYARVAAWEHGLDIPDVDGISKGQGSWPGFGKQGIGEFPRAGFV